jgi:urease alpha subunit
MIQSTDELPLNFGFYAKGNTSKLDGIAKELEDQLIAGAIGYFRKLKNLLKKLIKNFNHQISS